MEQLFKNACWLRLSLIIERYLMSNAEGRWDGAEKATRHSELCSFYVAVVKGSRDEDRVRADYGEDYSRVHHATQALTDNLDEVIGFPLSGRPDYDVLGPLFFEHFHCLAMSAMTQPGSTHDKDEINA